MYNSSLIGISNVSFYISKASDNKNTNSYFLVETSADGETWTDQGHSVTFDKVGKYVWTEVSITLQTPVDGYVRVSYKGTTAKRLLDKITITYQSEIVTGPVDATWNVLSPIEVIAGNEVSLPEVSNYNGTVTITPSQEGIAEASYLNGTLTIKGLSEGSTTFTVKGTGSEKYNNLEQTFDVTVLPKPSFVTYYKMITSLEELAQGGEYLIVGVKNSNQNIGMGAFDTSEHFWPGSKELTVNNGIILNKEDALEWTITSNESNEYSISNAGKYVGFNGSGTKSCSFTESNTTNNTKFTVSVDADRFVFKNKSYDRELRFNPNTTPGRFSNYAASSTDILPVYLYKKMEGEPIAVSAAGYATYYTDHALEVPADAGIEKVFTVKLDEATKTLVTSTEYAAGQVIAANTGFIVKAAANTYYFPLAAGEGASDATNALYGTLEAATTTAPESITNPVFYKLAKPAGNEIGFYYGATDGAAFTNGAKKAYLVLEKAQAGSIRGFSFEGDTFVTGIQGVTTAPADGKAYDLSGRRVQHLQKNGLYIVNGKKVIK